MDKFDLAQIAKSAFEEALRERGHANILIAGRTGVGKSTLINSIFQGNMATTGQGRPVTKNTREISKKDIPLTIFDTRGLEMKEFDQTLRELSDFVRTRQRDTDPKNHIHVGWICISEDLRRVEDAEIHLAEEFADLMPTIGVITKARADQGFRAEVQELLPSCRNVVRVRSIRETLDDGHELEPMGLRELVQLTFEMFPEGQSRAFVAAQKADLELKRDRSHGIVAGAATAAGGIGAVPIPFADAIAIIPVQVAMIAGISATYGLKFSDGFLSTVVSSLAGTTVATATGRGIVAGIFKLFPGVGSIVGGAISATTAAAVTTALGKLYIKTLEKLFIESGGEPPSEEDVRNALSS